MSNTNPFPFVPNARIYGRYTDLIKIQIQQTFPSETSEEYNCGYYNPKTGRFSPYIPEFTMPQLRP